MQTPAYWDGTQWIVQSQTMLTGRQLRRIAKWLLPVQRQRLVGLSPGPKRDECLQTIKALEAGKIVCGVTGGDIFKATVGTGRIISLGAG